VRRYELMLVLRPDLADDRVQATLDRATRSITGSGGQIVKVGPWGRRRLAYPIGQYREGSYFIVIFDAPSEAIVELERGLNITEEAMRHLVTRIERPLGARRSSALGGDEEDIDHEMDDDLAVPPSDDEAVPEGEFIDESESEAAPAAIE
jgi:small subunit ribosomal protein S6